MRTLFRECLGAGSMDRNVHAAGAPGQEPEQPAHGDHKPLHGTTSWQRVSGQQSIFAFRFYSQCALN